MSLKAMWAGQSPASKFFFAVAVVLLSTVFFTFLSVSLASLIYGLNITEIESLLNDLDNPFSLVLMKFIQSFSTIGTFIVPAFLLAYLFEGNVSGYLKLSKPASARAILISVTIFFAYVPLINYLGDLNSRLSLPQWLHGVEQWMRDSEDKAARLTAKFLEINSVGDLMLGILIIGILPALGEELLFRGVIQKIFIQWSRNVHVGIWASAILFSALHLQFFGFVPRMLLGVMLGYFFVWSGTLWLPIVAHFINNASAVILNYLFKKGVVHVDADKIGTQNDSGTVVVSLLLTIFLIWSLYKQETLKGDT